MVGRIAEPRVRPLAAEELRAAAGLHGRGLPHEFISRFGRRFLERYYRAFAESPHAVALGVVDPGSGRVCGVLIGAFDVRAHYAFVVRRYGPALALAAAASALRDPRLLYGLVRTRLLRYLRGVLRSLAYGKTELPEPEVRRVGLLASVVVDEGFRGSGIGRALVEDFERRAWERGLEGIELVTLPDGRGAGPFYERLGWEPAGERVSRSGERYALYVRRPGNDSSGEAVG
ncbi:hypothetical protein RxyAA322_21140 [Rubrobacter xylanophilus]|uniref:N-acetyltransferase domain-containing protein n=1 Tax=Rubrobacter xylanophilus TaxID=49319 RepID=A0A510HJS6_9ACTN|nr:GNAT family N-acetyltransferase [Rubrobacter xylanophilus]BBL80260.1 hypothetical protein RxyAA322_21140 [Rubrobacter xylanophilus]